MDIRLCVAMARFVGAVVKELFCNSEKKNNNKKPTTAHTRERMRHRRSSRDGTVGWLVGWLLDV